MIFRKIRHRLGRYPAIRTLALRTLHRRAYREDVRRRLTPQRRLSYFILNILDHCNLGCAGCDHFAPLAERRCVPVEDIARDLARIAEILRGDVASIGVMGGEPLLHPRLEEILARTRRFLPETDIMLVTNGILLPVCGSADYHIVAGQTPPYRYLWVDNIVAADDAVPRMVELLDAADGPAFVARYQPTLDCDDSGEIDAAIERNFEPAAVVEGIAVLRRTGSTDDG